MRASSPNLARIIPALVAAATGAMAIDACNGSLASGTSDDGGSASDAPSPAADGATSQCSWQALAISSEPTLAGCTMHFPVDGSSCEPQMSSATFRSSCDAAYAPCTVFVTIACPPDAGADAGADVAAESASDADAGAFIPPPWPVYADAAWCTPICNVGRPLCLQTARPIDCVVSPYSDAGGLLIGCGGCTGRPPRAFVPRPCVSRTRAGACLAAIAQLEAASVGAFVALHDDLARIGAPPRLLARIRAAAADEVRHARVMRREAVRFGAAVPEMAPVSTTPRTLEALAIENAAQGCVKETFGATVAAIQAENATDLRVKRAMRRIARDELRHARLAWDIGAWLEARLDDQGRARVAQARVEAYAELRAELVAGAPGIAELGFPDAAQALSVLDGLRLGLEAAA